MYNKRTPTTIPAVVLHTNSMNVQNDPASASSPRRRHAVEMMFPIIESKRLYWDRSHYSSPEEQMKALEESSTLYVGNLAFTTRTMHIVAHFSHLGLVKKVHMGLDRIKKTPCGFCFVEYFDRRDALAAVAHLSSTKLDGRIIRVELDAGFQPGRQFGRGAKGGQVRDDRRIDSGRKRARTHSSERDPAPSGMKIEDASGGHGHYGPARDEPLNSSEEPAAKRLKTEPAPNSS